MDEQKEQPKKWPDTVAFQDEFTREFMASTKEVKEGYYLFQSQTDGYTMLFPKDAVVAKGLYERDGKDFESLAIGWDNEEENLDYSIDLQYEQGEYMEDIKTNLYLLSSRSYADYNGVFCKEKIQSFATKSAENYNLTWSLWGRDEKARKPAISRAGYA